MKNKTLIFLLSCTLFLYLGSVGCASFSRRYVAEKNIQPEKWHLYVEAFGFANAGLFKKLTDRKVILTISASRMQKSEAIGRIVEATAIIDGTSLSKANSYNDLSSRSHLTLNEVMKDENGNDMRVPIDIPSHVRQIEVSIILEFSKPDQSGTNRKITTLFLLKKENMSWVSPLEYWWGPIL